MFFLQLANLSLPVDREMIKVILAFAEIRLEILKEMTFDAVQKRAIEASRDSMEKVSTYFEYVSYNVGLRNM